MKAEHLSDTINKVFLDNGDIITLIGTAHVSANSVEEVSRVIDEVQPDRVCLELDQARMDSKTKEKDYSNMDLSKVFKEGKAFLVLANTILASYQKKMGTQVGGINPGEEILSAGRIAKDKNIPISLCDRDINTTFKRAWRTSNLLNKAKMLGTLLSSAFDKEEYTAEELEKLKNTDNIQEMLNEVAKELPEAKKALIDERDRFLATSIMQAPGHNKVAIIGAGHAKGVIETIGKVEKGDLSSDLSDISSVPEPSKAGKIAQWAIPALILGFVAYSCFTYGFNQGVKYFLVWAGSNATATMLFAILSCAHPLNWLVSAISAPIAVMNPVLGVGIFTGIAESKLRKPKVKDFENISEDVGKFKGWFKNRVLHAFLIFFTTSIGSILGTFVLFPIMLKFF